jgi:hypothetical protein
MCMVVAPTILISLAATGVEDGLVLQDDSGNFDLILKFIQST